jgi:homopolymeric O-antigen transport system ATP-binding protein
MKDIAIFAEGLSKQYHVTGRRESYKALRDVLMSALTAPFRCANGILHGQGWRASAPRETFWALKDISFAIKRGEVVGIIGRKGAGKSTLLKILSRITEPTSGFAEVYGRMGSLLEVGTGFHPELSGRENIYLNGAILGMKRADIRKKFDEIVAFAEVEKFIDTPVKHYSSGMYLRLAFAVAAHLEPEILLVDEVLAVGDVTFQRKCLGKIKDVAGEGRTVLFVSHNLAAIQGLCDRGIFIHQGRVFADGNVTETVETYLRALEETASQDLTERTERRGHGKVRLLKVEIRNGHGRPSTTLMTGRPASFCFYVDNVRPQISCTFTVYDHRALPVTFFSSAVQGDKDSYDPDIGATFICVVDELLLVAGRYRINVAIASDGELQDIVEAAAFFDIAPGQLGGRPVAHANTYGSVCMHHRWTVPRLG